VRKRIVLTGGPGAGKTAVLELLQQLVCEHVVVLPEAASMLFNGGFPRGGNAGQRAATQRAIYHVQRELEASADAADHAAIVLCDRGTVDGAAYWPGPDTLWSAVGTTRETELARYDVAIHLRTPSAGMYNHDNPARVESAEEAARVDARIAQAWQGHSRVVTIAANADFIQKAQQALRAVLVELPECCREPAQRASSSSSTAASSSTFTGLVR
jgi:predicted ATPase